MLLSANNRCLWLVVLVLPGCMSSAPIESTEWKPLAHEMNGQVGEFGHWSVQNGSGPGYDAAWVPSTVSTYTWTDTDGVVLGEIVVHLDDQFRMYHYQRSCWVESGTCSPAVEHVWFSPPTLPAMGIAWPLLAADGSVAVQVNGVPTDAPVAWREGPAGMLLDVLAPAQANAPPDGRWRHSYEWPLPLPNRLAETGPAIDWVQGPGTLHPHAYAGVAPGYGAMPGAAIPAAEYDPLGLGLTLAQVLDRARDESEALDGALDDGCVARFSLDAVGSQPRGTGPFDPARVLARVTVSGPNQGREFDIEGTEGVPGWQFEVRESASLSLPACQEMAPVPSNGENEYQIALRAGLDLERLLEINIFPQGQAGYDGRGALARFHMAPMPVSEIQGGAAFQDDTITIDLVRGELIDMRNRPAPVSSR